VRPRVAILDDYQHAALEVADWSALRPRAGIDVFTEHIADPDELVRRLSGYDVVVAMRERTAFPESVLEQLPSLRLLVTTGRRNAAIDVAAARRLGITACGTRSDATATVEHTWALILGLSRNLETEAANIRAGGWQTTLGTGLSGKTLGVVGLGRLGSAVAGIGKAFGMDVVAWSANLTEERAHAAGARLVPFDELLGRADVVTLHLVLSDRTRHLVGARELGLMKDTGLLVNTSRGPIVDTAALVSALEAGTIAGAAVDVFDEEPLAPDHPLRSAPRSLVTPHLGYVTRDGYRIFYGDVVEDIVAFLDGSPVRVLE
jgi:phosphoglycerate dehydrogenase-like enzyme